MDSGARHTIRVLLRRLTVPVLLLASTGLAVPAVAAAPAASPRQSGDGWYGYVATGGTYTSVSATWTVPTTSCGTNGDASIWVGLDGYSDSYLEQAGLELECSSGTSYDVAFYDMYPAYPVTYQDTVAPGDTLTASVTYGGSGEFTLTVEDTTRGWSQSARQQDATAARSSAEVIVEPGTLTLPPVSFSHVLVNGQPISVCGPFPVGGSPVSPLGGDGESFSVG